MTFTELNQTINRFDADKVVEDVYEETKEPLADLNAVQLLQGLSAKGKNLKSYANDEYAALKNRMNPLPGYGNPDLRLTGAFYRGIYSSIQGGSLSITSSDSKTADLEKKYGELNMFGLSEKYRIEHVIENIDPAFKKEIERVTGLTME
jgi:hypothetical protein